MGKGSFGAEHERVQNSIKIEDFEGMDPSVPLKGLAFPSL